MISRVIRTFTVATVAMILLVPSGFAGSSESEAAAILESYVEDFRSDPTAKTPRVFGIEVVGAGKWSVLVSGKKDDSDKWGVELSKGAPSKPTFVYALDLKTLKEIHEGRLNALTAQGKALPSDITPMAVRWMEGAEEFDERPFSFHFWTRGFPEKVPFRSGGIRTIHSAGIGVFFYQKGFRSAWATLAKGQGANNGPGNPLMAPFPTMVIITDGSVRGVVNKKPVSAEAGEMIFIPPMTPHEWWNEKEEPAEAILLFFGEGA